MSETIVKPYNESEAKKSQVSKMFNNIAPYYDFLNHFLSLGIDRSWRKKAIAFLPLHENSQVLDVATGTADVALQIARTRPVGHITGIDISEAMLEIGKKKVAKENLQEKIHLAVGDSEKLNFPDNTFDAVIVAFGVRNFENLEAGLRDMNRVLKQGGTLVILEFSKPRYFPFKQMFNAYFKYILPLIGRFTSKDKAAYSYLYKSVQAFPEGQHFINILEKNNYQCKHCVPLTLGICSIYVAQK